MKSFDLIFKERNNEKSFIYLGVLGYLDAHTIEQFENSIGDFLNNGCNNIILDLKELTYISSAGIGLLMSLTQKLRSNGGELILINPSEKVYNILTLLGFTKIFKNWKIC